MSKKEIKYYSKEKLYKVESGKTVINQQSIYYIFIGISLILLGVGMYISIQSFQEEGKEVITGYSEKGKADYTVYLKDNTFYEKKFLPSGMQYVASLINTINTNFNYEIHTTNNLKYNYKYKVIGRLEILDQEETEKILYQKDYELKEETVNQIESNNIVINEDIDIDYDEFNNYVNAYKREYGLSVESRLKVIMYIDVDGEKSKDVEKLNKKSELQITIPLSEQTINIPIDTENIKNSGNLVALTNFSVESIVNLIIGSVLIVIGIIILSVAVRKYKDYKKDNIYTLTIKKILNEYDELIVNGNYTINEKKYNNIVYPEKFEEMVDASINLKTPILYYEAIKGEKSFFIIVKDDTLYKYRITKSYLENEEIEKADQKEKKEEEEDTSLI